MLTVQYQPELFWVGALLYWSCAHLLASKRFIKKILKRRLSARLHLIWLESRIDAHSSSLSLARSLSLFLQTHFFLSVSPQLQTQSDMDRNAKTDLEKAFFFFYKYIAVDILPVPALHLYIEERSSWTVSTRAIYWFWKHTKFVSRFCARQRCDRINTLLIPDQTAWSLDLKMKRLMHHVRQMFCIFFLLHHFSIGTKMLPGCSLPMQH